MERCVSVCELMYFVDYNTLMLCYCIRLAMSCSSIGQANYYDIHSMIHQRCIQVKLLSVIQVSVVVMWQLLSK